MTTPTPRSPLVVIVAALVVVALGVQMFLAQREQAQDDRDDRELIRIRAQEIRCIEEWSRNLIDTITVRVDAGTAEDTAEQARDDAVGGVLDVVILTRQDPRGRPSATLTGLSRATMPKTAGWSRFGPLPTSPGGSTRTRSSTSRARSDRDARHDRKDAGSARSP